MLLAKSMDEPWRAVGAYAASPTCVAGDPPASSAPLLLQVAPVTAKAVVEKVEKKGPVKGGKKK